MIFSSMSIRFSSCSMCKHIMSELSYFFDLLDAISIFVGIPS